MAEPRDNGLENAASQIKQLWEQVYAEKLFSKIPNKENDEIFAVYFDYESDQNGSYSLLIGCKILNDCEPPHGLKKIYVPKQEYAVFNVAGAFPKSLLDTWEKIWQTTTIARIYTYDFEVYPSAFACKTEKTLAIFVATASKS